MNQNNTGSSGRALVIASNRPLANGPKDTAGWLAGAARWPGRLAGRADLKIARWSAGTIQAGPAK